MTPAEILGIVRRECWQRADNSMRFKQKAKAKGDREDFFMRLGTQIGYGLAYEMIDKLMRTGELGMRSAIRWQDEEGSDAHDAFALEDTTEWPTTIEHVMAEQEEPAE